MLYVHVILDQNPIYSSQDIWDHVANIVVYFFMQCFSTRLIVYLRIMTSIETGLGHPGQPGHVLSGSSWSDLL